MSILSCFELIGRKNPVYWPFFTQIRAANFSTFVFKKLARFMAGTNPVFSNSLLSSDPTVPFKVRLKCQYTIRPVTQIYLS